MFYGELRWYQEIYSSVSMYPIYFVLCGDEYVIGDILIILNYKKERKGKKRKVCKYGIPFLI